jgi:hypothetical protein
MKSEETAMSVVSHHHHGVSWHRVRDYIAQDDFASAVAFLLIAIIIAVAVFAPPAFIH